MGYDRIAYFEGTIAETTLIAADKNSAQTVYGYQFKTFARNLGFAVRRVVDIEDAPRHVDAINKHGLQIATLPEITKTEPVPGYRVASSETFLEFTPPLNDETIRIFNAYFESHCEPSDAGLILDYRSGAEKGIGGY